MCQFFMKVGALSGTPKQIMCHSSKNAQPILTKFQGLLNLYGRHAVETLLKTFRKFLFLCPILVIFEVFHSWKNKKEINVQPFCKL